MSIDVAVTVLIAASAVVLLYCSCVRILKSFFWPGLVVLPLVLNIPWLRKFPAMGDALSLLVTAAVLWFWLDYCADPKQRARKALIASAVLTFLKPDMLPLVVAALLVEGFRRRATLPLGKSLYWASAMCGVAAFSVILLRPAPPGSLVWQLQHALVALKDRIAFGAALDGRHWIFVGTDVRNSLRAATTHGVTFYLPLLAPLVLLSLPYRKAWWYAPLYGWAAIVFALTWWTVDVPIFRGCPALAAALLAAFGCAGALVIRDRLEMLRVNPRAPALQLARFNEYLARLLTPAERTSLALCAITLVAAAWALPPALKAGPVMEDVNWADRSLARWWFPHDRRGDEGWKAECEAHFINHKWTNDYYREYFYALDHPSVTRIVYGAALRLFGVRHIDAESWDGTISAEENIALGHVLAVWLRTLLRCVNFIFFLGLLFAVYFGIARILANRLLGLFASFVFALEPSLVKGQLAILAYIGDDAILAFVTVLVWFLLVRLETARLVTAVVLGVAAGIGASTQINGVLLLAAAVACLAVRLRGPARITRPLVTVAAAALVFLALNPVYIGTPSWTAKALGDTLSLRSLFMASQSGPAAQNPTRIEIVLAALPYVYAIVPVAAVILAARKREWFTATLIWGACVGTGNLLVIHRAVPRYVAPVRIAFLVVFLAAGFSLVRDAFQRRLEVETSRQSPRLPGPALPDDHSGRGG